MAVLSNPDRVLVWASCMRDARNGNWGALTKADLRAAVDALDDFLETNASAINTAIPQPARAQLTVQQKALTLMYVIEQRYLRS